MIRGRVGVLAGAAFLTLGGCASLGGGGEPAGTAEISGWVDGTGIAPDLVYVTDLDDFDLMTQSVGVWGDDGMSAVYLGGDGSTVMLTTARTPDPTAPRCAELSDSDEPALRCSVERDSAHVVLEGERVGPGTLSAAAEAVRVPRTDDLGALFADLPPAPSTPVERGDLPSEGDGAPNNDVGVGG